MALRSASLIGPTRECGGCTSVSSTMLGWPFSSSVETSASPMPSCMMACSVSILGFLRKVVAADLTAFCSAGVKARSACWMRLPS